MTGTKSLERRRLPVEQGKDLHFQDQPSVAKEANLAQFQAGFLTFLKCRGEEMVDNGHLVLILNGREDKDFASTDGYFFWEKLGEAIADLVSEGFVEEDKLDTLNVPYYTASSEEVRGIVDEEGSFEIEYLEIMGTDRTSPDEDRHGGGRKMAKHARSFTSSIISHHLGEGIMDELYGKKLPIIIGDDLAMERRKGISLVPVLKMHVL
ncbi:hypothetical protein NL676_005000 [Syzygium grande]|nr:hypothetical protein NL676_005000 [Syzygium grande]